LGFARRSVRLVATHPAVDILRVQPRPTARFLWVPGRGPYPFSLCRGSGPLTLASGSYRHTKILALKRPTARGAALHLFGVSLARVHVIEEHPLILAFCPPELPPESVSVPARTK
jgi:hypothetical protein